MKNDILEQEFIGKRVRSIRGKRTLMAFGNSLGLKNAASYVHGIESGKQTPSPRFLSLLAQHENTNVHWVLFGSGSSTTTSDDEPTLPISFLEVEASAGKGRENSEPPSPLVFNVPQSLIRILFGDIKLQSNSYSLMRAKGNSMEPLIQNDELCLLDTSKRRVLSEKIYVFRLSGELFIKTLQLDTKKQILIAKSENPSYKEMILNQEIYHQNFRIIGQVVASIQSKRL